MERHEDCSLKIARKWKEKGQSQLKLQELLNETGRKIKFDQKYQIPKDR
jgi:hypothetical protein